MFYVAYLIVFDVRIMKIIESFLQGKKINADLCEDGLYISDDFIVVIDGVTSKGELLKDGRTSGRAARDIILSALETIPRETAAVDFFEILDRELQKGSKQLCKELVSVNMLRAVAVVYSAFYNTVWMCGDCCCMIDGVTYDNSKIIDDLSGELRSIIIGENPNNNSDTDFARNEILPLLKLQQLLENKNCKFGYAVLNGMGINSSLIKEIPLSKGEHTVILASDGYPKLFPDLETSENYLKYVLENDPQCCKIYKSTKGLVEGNLSFDDRCYCKFTI